MNDLEIAKFKNELQKTRLWLEKYASTTALSDAELKAAQTLISYIKKALAYCEKPKISQKELHRLRAKIEHACWTLDLKWRESGRRLP